MRTLAQPQSRPTARSSDSAPDHSLAHGTPAARGALLPLFLRALTTPAVQAKLVVDQPGDPFEQEADAVAESVARDGDDRRPRPHDAGSPRRETTRAAEPSVQPPDGGSALNRNIRARVEPALGVDLGRVRVHDSPAARDAAGSIGARAFTHKNHIWLGPNESADDAKLLTHEATHVVQQSNEGAAGGSGHTPAIQRQTAVSSSPAAAPAAAPVAASMPEPTSSSAATLPESSTASEPGAAADASRPGEAGAHPEAAASAEGAEGAEGAGGGSAEGSGGAPAGEGGGAGAGAGGGETDAAGNATGAGGGAVGGGAMSSEGGATAAPPVVETGAGTLETGDLVLIDVELAEHQRWEGALGRVGAAGSLGRAEFIAEAVGSGFISGAASGLAMGLGIGLVSRAVPAIGPVIGGAMALHGLVSRDWAETGATIGRFGEGNSTYEMLANTIASVAAVIDVVSQVLTVINGIVGIVQIAAAVIAGGAVVAAFFTFGATLGIAAIAADVVGVCEEISLGINAVTAVLDTVNAAILQPCVTLFRALHAFTTQADPREVEAQGHSISTAAANSGAALGAWAGGRAAHIGAGGAHPSDDLPPTSRPPHETPPPAAGDGPTVHFTETPASAAAHAEGGPAPVAHADTPPPVAPADITPAPTARAEAAPAPVAHAETPAPVAHETPPPAAAAEAGPPAAAPRTPEQLTLPGTEPPTTPPPRRPLTPDEVAPAGTNSAYLRRLRAEAAGEAPPAPGRRAGNIARHELPDRANIAGTWESTNPTPDLYQYSPRSPSGHESHHVEQQSAFRAPDGGEVIAGYNPREDPTVMMRRDPEHQATFAAQAEQRAQPDFHETVGTPAALEEAHNIAVWGTRDAPPPGTARPTLMDPRVAGQTVMEHSSYLFETSRLSGDIGPTEGVAPRPGETPLANRPTAGELVAPRGGVDPFENIDWGRTFDQPDPYRAAQPPGTQFALPGMEHLAPPRPPTHEQLTLPGIDRPGPNPNQLSLPFDRPPATPSSTPPPPTSPPPAGAPPPAAAPISAASSAATATTSPVVATPAPAPATGPIASTMAPSVSSTNTVSTFSAAAGAARTAAASPTTGGSGAAGGGGDVSWGTRAHQVGELFLPQIFGSGGAAPTYAQQQATHRARFTGDNQPAEGVERVNPEYPPPPATPAEINAIQDEIMNLLTVRAAAEQEAENQRGRADRCEENQGPIQTTIDDTTAGISAVQAHDAAVARRTALNQEQQQRQQESQGLVAGYPSRATGLMALSVPLDAWAGFTSLASHLPGDAGDAMLRMNREARQMQDAFAQMGAEMLGVETAGPAREAELQGDQGRLESTAEQAEVSDGQLNTASEGAAGLQDANEAALAEANQREEAATGRADECTEGIGEREARADSLAEQLRAWAAAHAAARQAAIAATEQRLVNEGRTVLSRSER